MPDIRISHRYAESQLSDLQVTTLVPDALDHLSRFADELVEQLIVASDSINPAQIRNVGVSAVFRAERGDVTGIRNLGRTAVTAAQMDVTHWQGSPEGRGHARGYGRDGQGNGMTAGSQLAVHQAVLLMRAKVAELASCTDQEPLVDLDDRTRAFQLAGGSIADETIVQAALFLASFVENIIEEIMRQLGRVIGRDGNYTGSVQDLYTALAENEALWGFYRRFKCKALLENAVRPRARSSEASHERSTSALSDTTRDMLSAFNQDQRAFDALVQGGGTKKLSLTPNRLKDGPSQPAPSPSRAPAKKPSMQPRGARAIPEEQEDNSHRPKETLKDLLAGDKEFSAPPQQRTAPAVILQTAPSHFSPSAIGRPTNEFLRDQGKSRFELPDGVASQSLNRPNRPPQLGRYAGHSDEPRPKTPAREMADFFNSPPPPPPRVPEPEPKGGFKGFMQKFGKRPAASAGVSGSTSGDHGDERARVVGGYSGASSGPPGADPGPQTSRGIAEEYRARLAAAAPAKQYSRSLNEPENRPASEVPPVPRTNLPRVAPRAAPKMPATDMSAQTESPRESTIAVSALSWLYEAMQTAESAHECRLILNSALMQLGVPRGDGSALTPEERVAGWLLGGMLGPDAQTTPTPQTSRREMQLTPPAAHTSTAIRADHQEAGASTQPASVAAKAAASKARAEARKSRIAAKQAQGVEDEQGYS